MNVDQCYQLGHILKTKGIEGEVVAKLDADSPQKYQKLKSLFLFLNGTLVPYFLQYISKSQAHFIIKLDEINTKQMAEEIVGAPIYLPLTLLPKLEKGYYYHELIGYTVWQEKNKIGTVKSIIDFSPNPQMVVDYNDKELLIPIIDAFITNVSKEKQNINVSLPEGYLAIFISS